MRRIIALIALISLMGGASAQLIFTGEGYSTSQLAFFNGQNTQDFQPLVENYWNSYIQNGQNQNPAITGQSNVMDIWLNSFSFGFDKQVQLRNSSFVSNAPITANFSSTEVQSAALTRAINFNFNQDQSWRYTPGAVSTLNALSGYSVPPKNAQGQIISQGIISLF
ncbi:MAG: hypothetical protein ACE14P_14760 [Methanotrichaceae archaeon]